MTYQINWTKESYHSTLLQDRPDIKWGKSKHVSVELVESLHNLDLHSWRCKRQAKQDATNINESSVVYKIKTSSLTMEANIVTDTLPRIPLRYYSQTIVASVPSHSVKIRMGNSKTACNNVWSQPFKTCGSVMLDMVRSVELMEQTDILASVTAWQLIASRMILSVEELERPETTS